MHIWRTTDTGPVWACEVAEADTPDGYTIPDMDPGVADPAFLLALGEALTSPQTVIGSLKSGLAARTVNPGDHGHVQAACRAIPGTVISTRGGR